MILSHRVLRFYANTRTIFVVFVLGNDTSVGVAESSNATKLRVSILSAVF